MFRRRLLPFPRPVFGAGPAGGRRLVATLLAMVVGGVPGVASATAPRPGPWRWPLAGAAQDRPGSGGAGSSPAGPAGGAGPEVTRGFEPPATPYAAGHRGVDLAGEPGVAVFAAGAGRVSYAGILAGRGVVAVAHEGGVRTTYEPVRVSVRPGQRVEAGHVLGVLSSGHPGCPRRACLHWGALRGGAYFDPLTLLRHGPVRLLPNVPDRPTTTPRRASASHRPGYEPGRSERPGPRSEGAGSSHRPEIVAALGVALAGAAAMALARGRGP